MLLHDLFLNKFKGLRKVLAVHYGAVSEKLGFYKRANYLNGLYKSFFRIFLT